jgi:hypothetical protein
MDTGLMEDQSTGATLARGGSDASKPDGTVISNRNNSNLF